MRSLLLAGLIVTTSLAAAPLSVEAADIPARRALYAPQPTPTFSWAGSYIGLNAGASWGEYRFDSISQTFVGGPGPAVFAQTAFAAGRETGFVGGYQSGYNLQFGSVVLGIETDTQILQLERRFALGPAAVGAFAPGDSFSVESSFTGSGRVRAGLAFDRFLVYGTGGFAYAVAQERASYVARPAPGSVALTFRDDDKYLTGWTVGAGVEYALTNGLSVGVEYRHTDFGRERFNLGAFTDAAGNSWAVSSQTKLATDSVTAKVNVKFDHLLGMFNLR